MLCIVANHPGPNSTSPQHGSFGGPGLPADEYYTAGSDDFRAYVWKVPRVEELKEIRRVVGKTSWVETVNESNDLRLHGAIGRVRIISTLSL